MKSDIGVPSVRRKLAVVRQRLESRWIVMELGCRSGHVAIGCSATVDAHCPGYQLAPGERGDRASRHERVERNLNGLVGPRRAEERERQDRHHREAMRDLAWFHQRQL